MRRAGDARAAARLFAEAGNSRQAVRKAFRAVLGDKVEHDAKAGPAQAAGLLASAGCLREASALFELAGSFHQAAKAALRSGQTARAGFLYDRAKQWTKAATAYQKAGQFEDAARVLDLEARRLRSAPTQATASRRHQVERKRAELLARIGRSSDAARALRGAAATGASGATLERAGRSREAIEAYVAAQAFDEDTRAAESWVVAGRDTEAATAFVRARRLRPAAEHFLAAGRRTEALQALRQISKQDPDFERGNVRFAALLFEDGSIEEALHRLRLLSVEVDADSDVGRERLYWEGRCLEALRRPAEARVRFEQLLAIDAGHRDAAARLLELVTLLGAATAAMPAVAQTGGTAPWAGTPAGAPGDPGNGSTRAPGTAHEATVLALGTVLADRYTILEELGHDGMGRVYKATDRVLGDALALKTVLAPQPGSQEEARLLREVQICRKITHPNIVRVHDIGRYGGGLFITMECLQGKSLQAVLARQGRLSLRQAKTVIGQIAQGLAEAHTLGIVHRDLKPGNVFITDRHVKILDFGIARMASQRTRLTRTGSAVGSPHYMSPEQLRGQDVDGRSDLYALGVLAFTVLAGHEPYRGETIAAVALAHLQQPVPDLRTVRADAPASWAEFIAHLLAKKAEERPQTASAVAAALRRLETRTVHATGALTEAVQPRP